MDVLRTCSQSDIGWRQADLKQFRVLPKNSLSFHRQALQSVRSEASTESKARNFFRSLKNTLVAAVASSALLLSPHPVAAEELIIPLSDSDEVTKVQRTLVEAWGIIRDTYFDTTFNKQDWNLKLKDTMEEVLSVDSADAAYSQLRNMLATLGDPFTRIVTPQEYENFRISNDGAVEGVGLLIATDKESGRLIVLGTIEGGPAERAGVQAGDELVQINDEALTGMDGEEAATRLRGKAGTIVDVKLRRSVPPESQQEPKLEKIILKRETIMLSPVFTAVLPHKNSTGQTLNTGYIRLTTFSQNAADAMKRAISKLEERNVDSYILDLRNNPGGLVRAGLDVAEMWLDGNETLVNTVDRHGTMFPINIAHGHALTHDPLVVLVNEGSASASEILAGALHDNGRALIVGHRTFGKGKIQSVSQLQDGSALFVTVAKYLSPALHQIDQVGIAPDVECTPFDMAKSAQDDDGREKSFLETDACVAVAEKLIN